MTEISEAALTQADKQASSEPQNQSARHAYRYAFARFIQEVSDAARTALPFLDVEHSAGEAAAVATLTEFVLQAPVDPLYEALFAVVELGRYDTREQTQLLRAELAKRGLKIVPADA